jgi:hypothetical protein
MLIYITGSDDYMKMAQSNSAIRDVHKQVNNCLLSMTYLLIYGHPQCPLPVAKSGKKERHEGFRDRFGKLDDLSSPALRR